MQSPVLRITSNISKICKRNIGILGPSLQKASDPIQQLFVDKIREYKSKSSGGKLVEPSPELERELKSDKERVLRQCCASEKEDISKFPAFNFKEPVLEHPGTGQ